jgi:hypothetical protein
LVSLTPLKYTPFLGQLLAQFIIDNMQVLVHKSMKMRTEINKPRKTQEKHRRSKKCP